MKSSNPIQLRNLIKEHILDHPPRLVPPKRRNRRQLGELSENFSRPRSFEDEHLKRIKPNYQKGFEGAKIDQERFENARPFLERKHREGFPKPEDSKMDQLLKMMGRVIEMMQPQAQGHLLKEKFTEDGKIERCLQIIQQELIMKIIKMEADQNLWKVYTQLIGI